MAVKLTAWSLNTGQAQFGLVLVLLHSHSDAQKEGIDSQSTEYLDQNGTVLEIWEQCEGRNKRVEQGGEKEQNKDATEPDRESFDVESLRQNMHDVDLQGTRKVNSEEHRAQVNCTCCAQ